MSESERVAALVEAFRQLAIAELTHALESSPDTAVEFFGLTKEEQDRVRAEIERRATEIAERMAHKLQGRGLLDGKASPGVVNQIYKETLREFEDS